MTLLLQSNPLLICAQFGTYPQSKAVPRLAPVHVVAGFDHHDLLPLLPSHTNVNKQDQVSCMHLCIYMYLVIITSFLIILLPSPAL